MHKSTFKKLFENGVNFKALYYGFLTLLGSRTALWNFRYALTNDPWSYTSSEYEKRKYERILSFLEGKKDNEVLEIGCSVGVFTKMLAPHVKYVHAIDISHLAIKTAKKICKDNKNIKFEVVDIASFEAKKQYEIIVASEVLSFCWDKGNMRALVLDKLFHLLSPKGILITVVGEKDIAYSELEEVLKSAKLELVEKRAYANEDRPYRIAIFVKK